MKVIKSPASLKNAGNNSTIFLAGSIENGKAEDWQAVVERMLEGYDVTILNPRREN